MLRQLDDPALTRDQRAQLRCQVAKELEEAENLEAAKSAMGELWQRIDAHPKVAKFDQRTAAEVLAM